jgi:Fe2+ or Zn2+ uptake regulation protein
MVGVGVKGASSRDGTAGELLRQEEPTSRTIAATRETEERQTGNVQITEALDLMGFDTNEQRFSVLRIALQKHHRQGIPIDFASIYEQLKTESGGKDIRRSQVYRSLMSLENDGYIQGDRGSHPFHYAATPETLIAAFGDAKAKTLKTLEMRCEEINSEIDGLSGLNLIRLAIDTIEIATGVPSTATAAFAEGHDQIRELTDNEIYSATRKGDTLRVSLGWTCSIPNITQARIETLMEPVKRGARTKVLLGKHWEEDDSTIAPLRKAYESLLQDNRDVAVRLRTTKDSTYQLVARNNEGILLIVSEEPPAATYIPRSVNERLVDDAIASFDAEFEKGVDLRSTTVGSTGE